MPSPPTDISETRAYPTRQAACQRIVVAVRQGLRTHTSNSRNGTNKYVFEKDWKIIALHWPGGEQEEGMGVGVGLELEYLLWLGFLLS